MTVATFQPVPGRLLQLARTEAKAHLPEVWGSVHYTFTACRRKRQKRLIVLAVVDADPSPALNTFMEIFWWLDPMEKLRIGAELLQVRRRVQDRYEAEQMARVAKAQRKREKA